MTKIGYERSNEEPIMMLISIHSLRFYGHLLSPLETSERHPLTGAALPVYTVTISA